MRPESREEEDEEVLPVWPPRGATRSRTIRQVQQDVIPEKPESSYADLGVPAQGSFANSASENRRRLLVPLSTTARRIVRRPVLSCGYGDGLRGGRRAAVSGAEGRASEGKRRGRKGIEERRDWMRVGGGAGAATEGELRGGPRVEGGARDLAAVETAVRGADEEGVGCSGNGDNSNIAVNSNRSGMGVVVPLQEGRRELVEELVARGRGRRTRKRTHLMTTSLKSGGGGELFLYLVTGL